MSIPRSPSPVRPSARTGFTIVELLVVVVILATGISMLSNTVATVGRLHPVNQENVRALLAVRSMSEELRGVPFDEVFALYNDDPADDPGPGAAPGAGFAVPGLDPQTADPDGLVGRVVFPEAGGVLREDVVDRELGMPRDLDLDGFVDGADHAADYEILPIRIELSWRGRNGDRDFAVCTALVRP